MFTVQELTRLTGGKLIAGNGNIQTKGISIDSRTIKKQELFLALKGDNFDGADFISQAVKKGASCVIKEHGKGKFKSGCCACLEVKDSIKALGDIARYHRLRFNIPVVAITGSNGKTTTKEMVSWVLSKKFKVLKTEGTKNNQIGLPLTLLGLSAADQVAVVELGTNHFGEIKNLVSICLPNIGLITNIGPSHLEYFGNAQGVLKEKYALVENLSSPAVAILNADDRLLRRKLSSSKKTGLILGFGTSKYSDFRITRLERAGPAIEFQVNARRKIVLPTIGAHNVYNALAAISCARILGLSYDQIASRLARFEFPSGRLKMRKFDSAKFIDDTYNSSPASLKQALYALEDFPSLGSKIVIMGDMMELGDDKEEFHYEAGKQIARVCDKFIAVGKLSKVAADAARHSGFDTGNLFSCGCVEQARELLFKKIGPKKEDVVLVKGSRAMKMEKIFEER
jgi:UDP-N-acetylmuramoyl-tripeptide--D-alanyl-D-alanine ligase